MKKLITIFLLSCIIKAHAGNPFSTGHYIPEIFATTYYVSTTGNDATGTGAIGNPWASLHKACQSVTTSGDIIHVNAGTYTGTLTDTLSVGVSIEGADSATTIIKNTGITSEFVEILSMRSAEGTSGAQHISNIQFDGNLTNYWGIYIAGRSNVSIYNCSIKNFINRGIIWGGRNDNNNIEPTIYATGNSIHDNIVSNCAEYDEIRGYGSGCVNIGGQIGMEIYNNVISQNSRADGDNGWPIKYYNEGFLKGLKIYNNTLNKIQNFAENGSNNWDFAIELFNEYGLEVYGNTINGGSVDINHTTRNGYAFGARIYNNTFTQPTQNTHVQTGVTVEFESDSIIIENNTFDKLSIGVLFTPRNTDSVQRVRISNNLFTNIGRDDLGQGGAIFFNNSSTQYVDGIRIYNNTFLETVSTPTFWGIRLPSGITSGYAKNIDIRNNIMNGTLSGAIVIQGGSVALDSLNISYNNFYNNGVDSLVLDGSPASPTHYTSTNLFHVNPYFGVDYKLVVGSTLVNAGQDVGYGSSINYTDSTTAAPPIECTGMDSMKMGSGLALSNSHKTITKTAGPSSMVFGQQPITTGDVYFEFILNTMPSPRWGVQLGIVNSSASFAVDPGGSLDEWLISGEGILYHGGYFSDTYTTLNTWVSGDTIGIAVKNSTGEIFLYRNRVAMNASAAYSSLPAGTYYPAIGGHDFAWVATTNFDPSWTPSGFTALCTSTPPTANAGADTVLIQPTSSLTIVGSGTDAVSQAWTQISGPATITFTNGTTFTPTLSGLTTAGTYVVRLTVTGDGTATDDRTITVRAAPTVNGVINRTYSRQIIVPH